MESEKEVFECSSCSKQLKSRKRIVRHLKQCKFVESNIQRIYECVKCPRKFTVASGLLRHNKRVHQIEGARANVVRNATFRCPYCVKTFSSKEGCRKHKWKMHVNEMGTHITNKEANRQSKTLFGCVYCDKKFTRKVNRKKHESVCKEHLQVERENNVPAEIVEVHLHAVSNPPDEAAYSVTVTPTQQRTISPEVSPEVENGEEPSTANEFCIGRQNETPSYVDSTCSPSTRAYLRDRPSFIKLRTPDVATPRRARMNLKYGQETVEQCVRKIKCLQQENRRLRNKVVTMKELIQHLRECPPEYRIPDNVARTLDTELPDAVLQLAIRKKSIISEKYHPELRKFALTLHFYSPKSYDYVREEFDHLLPHPTTIRKWYQRIDGEPGFSREALNTLKAKAAASPIRIICGFMMDEIDIRSEVTYRHGTYHGYEDLGFGYSDADSVPLAQKAMVFMLVALNGHWKIPIAYFLVKSLLADELSKLVEMALILVDETDVVVRSATFDGIAVNLSCFKTLGANFDLGPNFQPWFPHPCHPNEKVFLFLDPPHALKLARNTLGDYVLVDDKERGIKFADIKQLFYLNQEREVYSAPRLTKRHIQWRENKMRVRYAAQTLSASVAAALLHAKKKGFPKFAKCDGTAEYCLQFDRMFDILNCRSVFSKKVDYYVPVNDKNLPKIKVWVSAAEKYIRSLKIVENPPRKKRKRKKEESQDANPKANHEENVVDVPVQNPPKKRQRRTRKKKDPPMNSTSTEGKGSLNPDEDVDDEANKGNEEPNKEDEEHPKYVHWEKRPRKVLLEHRRNTGFLGFIISLNNLIPLYLSLKEYGLKYLLPYKLSQDHLEIWFSAVRSRNGCNNNPNAEQFKASFKRLLVHHEIKTSEGSNCGNDDTAILTVPAKSKKGVATGLLMELFSDDVLQAVDADDLDGDLDEFETDGSDLSPEEEYDKDCVAYLSGFLIRKLEDKKLATLQKVMNLKDDSNGSDLIDLKNRGKLMIPSKILVELCSKVNQQFKVHEEKLLHPDTTRMDDAECEILYDLESCGYMHRMDPHIVELITRLYIRIKIRYVCKRISTVDKDIRHTSKKQPIFAHQ